MDDEYEVWIGLKNGEEEMYAGSSSLNEAKRYYDQMVLEPGVVIDSVILYKVTREVIKQESL
jgi:hypothetical protein